MTWSLILAGFWLFVANVLAMIPSKDNHWFRAYILMAFGFPLLIWVIYENGWLIGALVFFAAAWILRWPVYYLLRYIKRKFRQFTGHK